MKKTIALLTLAAALTGCAIPAEEVAAPPAAGAEAQPSEETTNSTAPKKWVTVATLRGSGNKRGESFHLSGGDARLTYRVKGTFEAFVMAVYVMDKGTSLEKEGGFPEVTPTESGKESTQLAKEAGDYYLEVQAANATWSVTVEEKR